MQLPNVPITALGCRLEMGVKIKYPLLYFDFRKATCPLSKVVLHLNFNHQSGAMV
jgi:hypothetical protein